MLFPLERNKATEVNCLWQCAAWVLADLHVGLWVKQGAAHGRTLSTFPFCFSTSESWMSSGTRVALCVLEGLCSTLCASLSCTQLSTKLWNCSCWLPWPLLGRHPSSRVWEAPGFWENKRVGQDEKWAGRAEIHEKLPVIHGLAPGWVGSATCEQLMLWVAKRDKKPYREINVL